MTEVSILSPLLGFLTDYKLCPLCAECADTSTNCAFCLLSCPDDVIAVRKLYLMTTMTAPSWCKTCHSALTVKDPIFPTGYLGLDNKYPLLFVGFVALLSLLMFRFALANRASRASSWAPGHSSMISYFLKKESTISNNGLAAIGLLWVMAYHGAVLFLPARSTQMDLINELRQPARMYVETHPGLFWLARSTMGVDMILFSDGYTFVIEHPSLTWVRLIPTTLVACLIGGVLPEGVFSSSRELWLNALGLRNLVNIYVSDASFSVAISFVISLRFQCAIVGRVVHKRPEGVLACVLVCFVSRWYVIVHADHLWLDLENIRHYVETANGRWDYEWKPVTLYFSLLSRMGPFLLGLAYRHLPRVSWKPYMWPCHIVAFAAAIISVRADVDWAGQWTNGAPHFALALLVVHRSLFGLCLAYAVWCAETHPHLAMILNARIWNPLACGGLSVLLLNTWSCRWIRWLPGVHDPALQFWATSLLRIVLNLVSAAVLFIVVEFPCLQCVSLSREHMHTKVGHVLVTNNEEYVDGTDSHATPSGHTI